ncbi:MAG: hypothetical protein WDW38_003397 [Sanguina aurantia]
MASGADIPREVLASVSSSTGQQQQQLNATSSTGKPAGPRDLRFEILAAVGLIVYLLNMLWGRRENISIAQEWTAAFGQTGGILDRNFAVVAAGSLAVHGLVKESQNQFKLYASGRRFCQGMMCTLNLQARQDLATQLVSLVDPKEDTLQVEVYMNESAMPMSVLAVAVPKAMRALVAAQTDVSSYSKALNVAESTLGGWPKERALVRAEHSTLFYELMSDPRILSVFAAPPAKAGGPATQLKYFRSMHFTSDNGEGSHKHVLRFTFAIPPKGSVSEMSQLMALVPLCIDAVASYKMSPDVRRKAVELRAKTDASSLEDARKAVTESIAAKKSEKMLQEKERISKLSPEARYKYEEKQAKQATKSALKSKIRMK